MESQRCYNTRRERFDKSFSQIALGCMRMHTIDENQATEVLEVAKSIGINFFDHADIYGSNESERRFAKAMKNVGLKREDYILQSKCGITPQGYNFSKSHILNSVYKSLERLESPYLDFLLLHRPDTLMDPEEVAEAFSELKRQGLVSHFGVSNFRPGQIALLQSALEDKLCINQMQFGLGHTALLDSSFHVNMNDDAAVVRDSECLEYCRLNDILIQTWSPFYYGFFEGIIFTSEKYKELNDLMAVLAKKCNVSVDAIAVAWILRHPAKMQVLVGATEAFRIKLYEAAMNIELTREEWYALYKAAGNQLP